MTKVEEYREELRQQSNWDDYLRKQSGLPGPRGNLELAQAVVEEGDQELFEKYISYTPDKAPENTPEVFLAFCGVVGLGRLVVEGKKGYLARLREFASDPRWRIREGVAMALQRIGDSNMEYLVSEMEQWCKGAPLEQRAAAAGLCEPRLLKEEKNSRRVLDILNNRPVPSQHARPQTKTRYFLDYGFFVAAHRRDTCLDLRHTYLVKQLSDSYLFVVGKNNARSLLAIA